MKHEDTLTQAGQTATGRRVRYGLNISIAIVVASAIVVILNILAYKYLEGARFDSTHSRKYSLSKQTRKLLANLGNEYRIVTLIEHSVQNFESARDLIEEYGHLSDKVTVDHLNPTSSRGSAFFQSLQHRYKSELEPLHNGIEKGQAAVQEARGLVAQYAPLLEALDMNPLLTDPQQKALIRQVLAYLGRFAPDSQKVLGIIDQKLALSLPDLDDVLRDLRTTVESVDQMLQHVGDQFNQWIENQSTPAAVKDQMLQLAERFRNDRTKLSREIASLRKVSEAKGYNLVRSQLRTGDTVVVMGQDQVRVIALLEMFRQANSGRSPRGEENRTVQLEFTGEEQITGALVSMELKEQPMAVFVMDGQQRALGPGGQYTQVAQRLRTMNFEVREWNPMPPPQQFGRPTPPKPVPEAKPGQQVVWIVPPRQSPDPRNPQSAMGDQRLVQVVRQKMEAGDAALIMFAPNPAAMFGAADPFIELVGTWGLTPQNDRLIYRRIMQSDRRTSVIASMNVTAWPDELPITAALVGMPGIFPAASPLITGSTEAKDIQHWELVNITGKGLWAETDMRNQNPRYDKAKAGASFTIAVAAQQGDDRLIVVTDPAWATDQATTYGLLGPGTASMTGAAFPANAELFLNCVYWLVGLDELIAASARTQDIRRINSISDGALAALQWGLPVGLPLISLAIGVGVWMNRRG